MKMEVTVGYSNLRESGATLILLVDDKDKGKILILTIKI